MLPEKIITALKEWAVVQRALLEGHQIILLRKGGIIEDTGEFNLKAKQFLIYPTYEHETDRLGDIQPCFSDWLKEEESRKPLPEQMRIEAAAEVTDVIRLNEREVLKHVSAQHIWNEQFINGRFDWEPYKPVFLLLLRAYRLANPQIIEVRQEYGGCRSWIEIADTISIIDAIPAISDETFEQRRQLTLDIIARYNTA